MRADRLRELLAGPEAFILPGAFNALSARLVEAAGFPAVHLTGYSVTAALLGQPDVGLIERGQMVEQAARAVAVTSIPVTVDIDQGYGDALAVYHTVRDFVRAGVAAVDLDDQVAEVCPYLGLTRALVPIDEMVGKIRAAQEARGDADLVLMVKSSIISTRFEQDGRHHEEYAARARAYAAAGADVVFGGWKTEDDLRAWAAVAQAIGRPTVAVMVPFVPTRLTFQDLAAMGYRVVMYPVDLLYASVQAGLAALGELGRPAGARNVVDHQQFEALVGMPAFIARAERFLNRNVRAMPGQETTMR